MPKGWRNLTGKMKVSQPAIDVAVGDWRQHDGFTNNLNVAALLSNRTDFSVVVTGGTVRNPSYEQVTGGRTGHREAVRVVYDPARVSYARLLDAFWRTTDPTDDGYAHYTLDLSHTATAGVDAVDLFERMGPALSHLHLADGSATFASKFATIVLVALIFGVVNAVVKPIAKVLAFPAIVLAIGVTASMGIGLRNAMFAVGIVLAPAIARLARAQTLSVKEMTYVEAARSFGAKGFRGLILPHIVPNTTWSCTGRSSTSWRPMSDAVSSPRPRQPSPAPKSDGGC